MDKAEALLNVIHERGIEIPRAGNISCLLHSDDRPSMSVDRQRGLWNCHSCGKGGDVYTLLSELDGTTFEEARVQLGGGSVPVETTTIKSREEPHPLVQAGRVEHLESLLQRAEERLRTDSLAQDYIASRGLTEATATKFRLGLGTHEFGMMRDYLIIPYLGPNNRPLQLRGRCIQKHEHKGHGKYVGSAGERTRMFNTNAILEHPTVSTICVTEGELDAVTLSQCGYPVVVGFPGAQNFKRHQLLILRGFDNVLVLGDNDPAGYEFTEKIMSSVPQARAIHVADGDVNSTLLAKGAAGVRKMVGEV